MTISLEQLSYASHINSYRAHLTGDRVRDEYWHLSAQGIHALVVSDAIRDIHINAVALSQNLGSAEAQYQLTFGVARRAKFIWLSLRSLLSIAAPNRKEPLSLDDGETAARDLNVIYINIRGTLDNLAWCAAELLGSKETKSLKPIQIALFSRDLLSDPGLVDVARFVEQFRDWNTSFKDRRDPSAHRIPLSVPPAVLDEEAHRQYVEVSRKYADALNSALRAASQGATDLSEFNKVDFHHEELQQLGKFVPVFVHHPLEGAIEIYPTVPEDIGQLVKVARGMMDIFSQVKAAHKANPDDGPTAP